LATSKSSSWRGILLEGAKKYILALVIVFGSVFSLLEYVYNITKYPEVRLLVFPLAILLGYFAYLFYDVGKKYLRHQRQRTMSPLDALDTLKAKFEETFGFKNVIVENQREISLDGSVNAVQKYEIQTTRDGVSSRMHFFESIGTKLLDLTTKFRVTRTCPGHTVSHHFYDSLNRFRIDIRFSPPLDRDDSVAYEILSTSKQTFLMTKEEVMDKIRKGKWIIDEPYEYSKFLIIAPTDKLSHAVTFPPEYEITGEELFDVTVGESSYRCDPEYDRLIREKSFSAKTISDENNRKRAVLSLDVKNPIMGLCYWIRWIPPSTK
jgi:hypothetical protein